MFHKENEEQEEENKELKEEDGEEEKLERLRQGCQNMDFSDQEAEDESEEDEDVDLHPEPDFYLPSEAEDESEEEEDFYLHLEAQEEDFYLHLEAQEEDFYLHLEAQEEDFYLHQEAQEEEFYLHLEAEDESGKEKEDEAEEDWKWWKEEDKKPEGVKWDKLSHMGPLFAPPYIPLPSHVKFLYAGKEMKLSADAEEVATFYGRMIDHEYVTMKQFNINFMKDWREVMTAAEREVINDLTKCDFRQIETYFKEQSEIRKAMSKEEKLKIKEGKDAEVKIYGMAIIDGHEQKVANFRIEPPGLFRGRGDHPKMGMHKKRIRPEDVIINCGKNTAPKAPEGHEWKEVRHDSSVTWLCSWSENVLGSNKYIRLHPSSKIKGEKDYKKYETARRLKNLIGKIRENYREDWKSQKMRVRQRAVALYFIDKLALRAGNEKDVDKADTVGCCSLRVEHIKLHPKLNGKDYVVVLDFLGKDSIRYYNKVPVKKRVFKNLQKFQVQKAPDHKLFDRLNTTVLNQYLHTYGLTVKVFRTYKASIIFQDELNNLTKSGDNVHQKMLSYNRANRQVAILCNHQRAVPKTHEKSMENLDKKIKEKKAELAEAKVELEKAQGTAKEKALERIKSLEDQLMKLEIARTIKDENKLFALNSSKLNYIDPRISVAWCKKYDVPLEKVFNKTHRKNFRWAIDMVQSSEDEFVF